MPPFRILSIALFVCATHLTAEENEYAKTYYGDPNVVSVERDGKIVKRLPCERISLDFPDLAGRGEAHAAFDSKGDIWTTVGCTVGGKGVTRLFHSSDGGKQWTSSIIEPSKDGTPVVAFTVLKDDSMVVAFGGDRKGADVFVSHDMGKTWKLTTTLSPAPFESIGEGTMSMTQLRDGRVLYPIARFTHARKELRLDQRLSLHSIYVSTDGGATFPVAHSTFPDCFEAHIVPLRSGKLLGAFRFQRDRKPHEPFEEITALGGAGPGGVFGGAKIGALVFKNVFLGDSDDGVHWKHFRPVQDKNGRILLGFGQCYGRLVVLPDNRVVLVYDNRFPLENGDIRARVSPDGGQTWEPETYYLSLGRGYPSSVALAHGTIVTITGNTSYTPKGQWDLPWKARVIRWKLPS